MMGHHEKMKGGDEYDALTVWKHVIKAFAKPGLAAKAKKKFNRRVRKQARIQTQREVLSP